MIEWIIGFSIRHRWSVIAAGFVLAIAGIFAASALPVDAIPDLSEDAVIVFADWPGHAPREVEEQVTYPLALALQGMPGARAVRTSSDFNYSMVHVILDEGTTTEKARKLAAERVSAVVLPSGVTARLGPDAAATGQIFWYTVEGGGLDLGRLRAIQDWVVKPRLSAVAGVAEVASVGGFPIEFGVSADPVRMRARGVTLAQIVSAVNRSNKTVGGATIEKGNAEYLVRGLGALGAVDESDQSILRDLEDVLIAAPDGSPVLVKDVASVAVGPGPRRGILEKDGGEAVGGVILMAVGENPLEVTRRIKNTIRDLRGAMPHDVQIIPFYDRTPLIVGAIATVRGTVIEAMITATICVLVILLHVRTSFIIAITLPLAALGSFALMWGFRALRIADVQTNIMSLAGIAISIGVLVDSSIVMAENAMHRLREHFGDEPAHGDLRAIVAPACRAVGRPIFFSVVIMILSFLPVFALGGMEGKMFRPLALTKTFALATVAVLAITLVPALCTIFIRGRLRPEEASPIVRGVVEIYRPTLNYLLDRPSVMAWVLAATLVVGLAPIGNRGVLLAALLSGLVAVGFTARSPMASVGGMISLAVLSLAAESSMTPLGREFLTPLDEGMVMDMPITVPRASTTEVASDLKARDMTLCRFPEVDMVVGKAGRAETSSDPAPIDMIETMVNFRPREFWPRRKLTDRDARRMALRVQNELVARGMISVKSDARTPSIEPMLMEIIPQFDAQMREYAYQRNAAFLRDHAASFGHAGHEAPTPNQSALWRKHLLALSSELIARGAEVFARVAAEEYLLRSDGADAATRRTITTIRSLRERPPARSHGTSAMHHGAIAPKVEPLPALESIQEDLRAEFARSLVLWKKDRADLVGFGSEPDRVVNMPGWTNIWTMPIQNRVDMLATGVNTSVGVRVLGNDLDTVVSASEQIADRLKNIPGAADVVADPIRGKGYIEVLPDRRRAADLGVSIGDLNSTIETALGGTIATTVIQGRERHPVRVRYVRDARADESSVRDLLVPTIASESGRARFVRLADVAMVRVSEGPATIKGEAGLLRNYVRLNVRGRPSSEFVAEAQKVVSTLRLPDGVTVEWTGQFEHEARARRTLLIMVPVVVLLIFGVLYWTYRDMADALLMLIAVPGAIAGGVLFQWLMGYPFSVTVWVGYIACFGMATSTGIIMLVYLRDAVEQAGGLAALTPETLRLAVLQGAVHRLRPKLLTEATTILGLAPMLWADGPGAEIIRPMAAPVLGGLLVADEVIDLFLPVVFYHVRKWRLARIATDSGPGL